MRHTRLLGRLGACAAALALTATACSGSTSGGAAAPTVTPLAIPSTTPEAIAFTAKVNAVCTKLGKQVPKPAAGASQVAYFRAFADNLQKEYDQLAVLTPPTGYEGYVNVLAGIKPVPAALRKIADAYGKNDLPAVQKLSTQVSGMAMGNIWLNTHGMKACGGG